MVGKKAAVPEMKKKAVEKTENRILLSICIPTMNRAFFLKNALDSLSSQLSDELKKSVELVVYDNGQDGSDVAAYAFEQKTGMKTRYVHDSLRVGIDRSVMRVAKLASGDYCWFFSDDDIFEQGALARVLSEVSKPDAPVFIQLNKRAYSPDLSTAGKWMPPVGNGKCKSDRHFEGKGEISEFLGNFFYDLACISTQVVNRESYLGTIGSIMDIESYCTGHALAFTICRMLDILPRAKYIAEPCVGSRRHDETPIFIGGAFLEGTQGRLWLERAAGESFRKVAENGLSYFGPKTYRSALSLLARYHVRSRMISLNFTEMPASKKFLVWRKVFLTYWAVPEFWIYSFPFMLMPQPVLHLMKQKVAVPASKEKANP